MGTVSCYNKDLAIKQVSRGAIILIFSTHLCVCVCVCVCVRAHTLSYIVMSDSLQLHGLQPTRLLCPWNFPGSGLPFHTPWNNSQPRN